jgi:hypothetical protein
MKLLFVYNADSGLAAALFDSAHKLLSPQTYACNLCALTHGLARGRPSHRTIRWRRKKQGSGEAAAVSVKAGFLAAI